MPGNECIKSEAEVSHTLRHSKFNSLVLSASITLQLLRKLWEEDECAPLRTAKTAGIIKNGVTRNSH